MTNQAPQGHRGGEVSKVFQLLDRWIRGWEHLDAEDVMSTIAPRPDVLIWGTDADESWDGREAFRRAAERQVAALVAPRYAWEPGGPHVWVFGGVAVAAGILDVSVGSGTGAPPIPMRSTFVMTRSGDEWAILHAHYSVGHEERVVEY